MGQVVHESGTFKYTKENLNYSVEAMMKVMTTGEAMENPAMVVDKGEYFPKRRIKKK